MRYEMSYICQQCSKEAEVRGQQDIDINFDTPFISEWVICESCGYTIPKDTADKQILLAACESFFEWHANHFEDFSDEVNGQLLCLANDVETAITKVKQ